ncbi:MAG: methylmalonyl-CoA epimerase, partial [Bacteroidota bacterium]
MIKQINHIGIAVKDLDSSIETFRKLFQFEDIHRETVEKQKVHVGSFRVGDVLIELTQPTDEGSPIAKFIEIRGEGIHHIGFETDDIDSDLERLNGEGIKLINEEATPGAHDMLIAFLHPKSTNGILT